MTVSIIILVVVIALIVVCRVTGRRVRDVIPNGTLRFWIWFLIVLLILWLNRYSLLALPMLIHSGHSFGEAMKLAFPFQNDISFFVDRMYQVCAAQGKEIPIYLDRSLTQVVSGEADLFTVIGDLFELFLYAW